MKRIFSLLIFFSSLFVNNQAFAQKDYVVLMNGDTIKGKIDKKVFGGLKFKAIGKSESKKLDASSFKGYFDSQDSINYVSLTLTKQDEPKFYERLENGKIKLYREVVVYPKNVPIGAKRQGWVLTSGVMTGPQDMITWYASKDDGELLEIKTNGILNGSRSDREKNFDFLIGSYAELLEDFKKEKSFSFDILRAYIKKYNYYYKYLVKN